MKTCERPFLGLLVLVALLALGAAEANAYSTFTSCKTSGCHDTFRSGSPSVHSRHSSRISCDNCHSGSSRTPVYTNSSTNYANYSCNGCHDVRGLATFHAANTSNGCGCHSGEIGTHPGENVLPYYYQAGRTSIVNPCRTNAANGGEDWDGDGSGLDNDGDGLRDANDPDCANIVQSWEATWGMVKAFFDGN